MVSIGETAPDFTLPKAGGTAYDDISEVTLSRLLGDGPIVLAFFPAAFTRGCTSEMCAFSDSIDKFENLNTKVYGISVDLPFAQNIWIEREGLNFPMLSDWDHEVIHQYDVVRSDLYESIEAARRSVFVVDVDRIVTAKWTRSGDNPDFTVLTQGVLEQVSDTTG